MSVVITIRDVPDETRNELAARAARRGQSLQQFMRQLAIETAERRPHDEVLERINARRRAMKSGISREQIVKMIREDRESH